MKIICAIIRTDAAAQHESRPQCNISDLFNDLNRPAVVPRMAVIITEKAWTSQSSKAGFWGVESSSYGKHKPCHSTRNEPI